MSLEVILANSIGVEVGVAVSLPPIHCGSKQLVRREEDLLTVRALSYLQFLLN
jgi:hypothetical protein